MVVHAPSLMKHGRKYSITQKIGPLLFKILIQMKQLQFYQSRARIQAILITMLDFAKGRIALCSVSSSFISNLR